ncbi:hypothetical protein [Streptomonospora salina]|uniref:Uncharacterized protein n=1 Tax=Streptomonospora salina TaxID=104205 RepID=A0A841EAM6_9ACTN|nr:hypothetical protein [Streptomonospora salina]MBB6000175.1 hypothetical protein [Streptomonospora salina]
MKQRLRRRRHLLPGASVADELNHLRARYPDRLVHWHVATPSSPGGWHSRSTALAAPEFQELGISVCMSAPSATGLANRLAAQDAISAGLATAMNLGADPSAETDGLETVRSELAPLAHELVQRLRVRGSLRTPPHT